MGGKHSKDSSGGSGSAASASSSAASSAPLQSNSVVLNVYEPAQSSPVGMVYHTGIVLYDTEHMYAAGQTSVAGILEHRPRQSGDPQWVFKESIRLGETNKSRQECRALIAQLKNSGEWRGDAYNVMRKSVPKTEIQVAFLSPFLPLALAWR